jgi:class 3 adenylate cyclase
VARLTANERAKLPDSAFAYVDAHGRRRLPINDEAHVRNALARFEQVRFEDDAARERARKRLLNAARKFGIVPVGFVTGQLESERLRGEVQARSMDAAALPTGVVTFLMTDIEGSTVLLRRLGDGYGAVLERARAIQRSAVSKVSGCEVDARADELFAVFERAEAAVEAAVEMQRALAAQAWPDEARVRVRAGIHHGRPTLTETGYIGLAVHVTARVCTVAHGGQVVVTDEARSAVARSAPAAVRFRALGDHHLRGLAEPKALFQVEADGLAADFPPPRAD